MEAPQYRATDTPREEVVDLHHHKRKKEDKIS
jgi:hypothetical protein